eukprot:Hpha_TRINITY_DN15525_c5_g1::TRINITY_DN15525_c5_g1_i2::g.107396::m.107396
MYDLLTALYNDLGIWSSGGGPGGLRHEVLGWGAVRGKVIPPALRPVGGKSRVCTFYTEKKEAGGWVLVWYFTLIKPNTTFSVAFVGECRLSAMRVEDTGGMLPWEESNGAPSVVAYYRVLGA